MNCPLTKSLYPVPLEDSQKGRGPELPGHLLSRERQPEERKKITASHRNLHWGEYCCRCFAVCFSSIGVHWFTFIIVYCVRVFGALRWTRWLAIVLSSKNIYLAFIFLFVLALFCLLLFHALDSLFLSNISSYLNSTLPLLLLLVTLSLK